MMPKPGGRAVLVLLGALFTLVTVAWASRAVACEPTGWVVDSVPASLDCVTVSESGETALVARNGCASSLTVLPLDCAASCPGTVVIPPDAEAALPLPGSPRQGERRQLSYAVGAESDTVWFEYVENACAQEGGCSTRAFSSDGVSSVSAAGIVLGFLLLHRRALRA